MSRATSVYIFMLVFSAAGLWVILQVGGALKAPRDLSGAWELTSYSPAPEGAPPDDGPRPILQIDQSGRFFEFRFPDGRVLDVRSAGESPAGLDGRPATMSFKGKGWELAARIEDGGRFLAGELTGPGPGDSASFTACHVREGHQPARPPNEPNRPAPTNQPAPAPPASGQGAGA